MSESKHALNTINNVQVAIIVYNSVIWMSKHSIKVQFTSTPIIYQNDISKADFSTSAIIMLSMAIKNPQFIELCLTALAIMTTAVIKHLSVYTQSCL